MLLTLFIPFHINCGHIVLEMNLTSLFLYKLSEPVFQVTRLPLSIILWEVSNILPPTPPSSRPNVT